MQQLIRGDRDPGSVPPRLPDDLADLPVLTAQYLHGAAVGSAPAEIPSDELMEEWRRAAFARYRNDAEPTWRTTALLAVAWARQQLAQSLQLPRGADPVASDKELLRVARSPVSLDDARRAIYEKGRADERAAIAKALGVEP